LELAALEARIPCKMEEEDRGHWIAHGLRAYPLLKKLRWKRAIVVRDEQRSAGDCWVCAAQLQDAGVVLKGLALLPMAVDVEQAAKTARCGLLTNDAWLGLGLGLAG
tara:strand:- start:78 stop:398 length:321 start_codon:yes stop_codon:yes gene_type:complete